MRMRLRRSLYSLLARGGLGPATIELRLRRQVASGLVTIGPFTYGTPDVSLWGDGSEVTIGAYCSIASGVVIYAGGDHRVDWVTTYPFSAFPGTWPRAATIPGHPTTRGPVRIGNDVWIGNDAAILSGVTIGNGAVVAARAVVTRDVAPYTIVAGNPARVIRRRFDESTIARLEDLAWWAWDPTHVHENVESLMAPPDAMFPPPASE